ncbi:hypothetical protein [Ectopseudomonas khazarica]|uniref:hypothetical protein n=1 Tax=Ectopseudomonas khazarica TaxID=2502979 RepID=UPI003B93B938
MANDEQNLAVAGAEEFFAPLPRIVQVDQANGCVMLVGATHGLTLMLCCLIPLLLGLMLAAQLALDFLPWPIGNYELTLLVWTALWLAFLVYSLCYGAYVETYLFSPQRQRLWHLNSGETLDLKALAELSRTREPTQDPATLELSPQERLLPTSAEHLLLLDWQQTQNLPPYRPSSLLSYLRSFWSTDAWWLMGVTIGICLLVTLLAVGSLTALFLAVLALAVAWLASALAGFSLQYQASKRAKALLGERSIEDVMRDEA